MNTEDMVKEFHELYDTMASSHEIAYMRVFGNVHKEMMNWMIVNKPELAREWIEKLESVRWKNFLTQKEADKIVEGMEPKAPWTRDQWRQVMEQNGYALEKKPCYNRCALYAAMQMIMSDSSETLSKYVEQEDLFPLVYDLAVDKLTDKDGVFNIRHYFGV